MANLETFSEKSVKMKETQRSIDMKTSGINFENRPFNYLNCLNDECPLAEKCMRRISARYSEENDNVFMVLNHRMLDTDNCKYYVENKKSDIAYGMKGSFEDVKAKDIAQIRKRLYNYFGQTEYFRRRNAKKTHYSQRTKVHKKRFCTIWLRGFFRQNRQRSSLVAVFPD